MFGLYPFERVSLALAPSSEKAMNYGQRHFHSLAVREFDTDHAEYFFVRAYEMDREYPYVNHELARIAFLKGDFPRAMQYIDAQIELYQETAPNSYYIRGLINGYRGDFAASADDYAVYLSHDPHNWAAINDYAWVLLKGERFQEALDATNKGLEFFPDNAWLWNSKAIALFELAQYEEALHAVTRASETIGLISERTWLTAYPGNDPSSAAAGVQTLNDSIAQNMQRIAGETK